jgi:hypothetical protein
LHQRGYAFGTLVAELVAPQKNSSHCCDVVLSQLQKSPRDRSSARVSAVVILSVELQHSDLPPLVLTVQSLYQVGHSLWKVLCNLHKFLVLKRPLPLAPVQLNHDLPTQPSLSRFTALLSGDVGFHLLAAIILLADTVMGNFLVLRHCADGPGSPPER